MKVKCLLKPKEEIAIHSLLHLVYSTVNEGCGWETDAIKSVSLGRGFHSVVLCLPRNHKVQSSISSTEKKRVSSTEVGPKKTKDLSLSSYPVHIHIEMQVTSDRISMFHYWEWTEVGEGETDRRPNFGLHLVLFSPRHPWIRWDLLLQEHFNGITQHSVVLGTQITQ